jgi:LacI family repressor for deo operon, udp, cdd, tsx, nupC, and nupG
MVNGCEFTGDDRVPLVAIDDALAARDATRHLLELGHRRIAVITGDIASTSSRDRLRGFRRALQQAGVKPDERCVVEGAYSLTAGEHAAAQLLLLKQRPTAIFCFSDDIALGCMYTLRQNGFEVPGDISVMGFDDIPFARYSAPPLTTVAQPTAEIGAACATLLLDQIDGRPAAKKRHILPHRLVVRDSTRGVRT